MTEPMKAAWTFQSTPSVWRETFWQLRLAVFEPFQSTPSVWRETRLCVNCSADRPFQSTPSVWRETRYHKQQEQDGAISIHSLRVEGDSKCWTAGEPYRFQSTPSVWRETAYAYPSARKRQFQSTPSVWRETQQVNGFFEDVRHFNPLPPCGGRLHFFRCADICMEFQSTPSVWRETSELTSDAYNAGDFNPLPPCGGRPLITLAAQI